MADNKDTLFKRLREEREITSEVKQSGARYSIRLKIFILIITCFILTFFFSYGINDEARNSVDYSQLQGSTWTENTIVAEYSFPIYKPYQEYEAERRTAAANARPVFKFNPEAQKNSNETLKNLTDQLPELTLQANENLIDPYTERSLQPYLELDEDERKKIARSVSREISSFVKSIYKRGFIDISRQSIESDEIILQLESNEISYFKTESLIDNSIFSQKAEEKLSARIDKEILPLSVEIVSKLIFPNFLYDENLSEKQAELAANSVQRTIDIVREGETIIERGQQITELQVKILQSYEKSRIMRTEDISGFWTYLGNLGHALLIYSILLLYIYFMRKRIFFDNVKLMILSGALILTAAQAWLTLQVISPIPLEYLILLPGLSMLVAITFDSRTAFYSTVTMAVLVAGIRGSDYENSTALLVAGMLAAYTVRDIQSRTQMYRSIFYILIGLSFAIAAFALERMLEFDTVLYKLFAAVINSAFSPLLTFGLLFLLERITNIATDLRIKEYDNLNHPLIVKLSEIAPGTYQHTLSLAVISERCATAIGANPLLCRVGAYFHDIGKLAKPEYFGENQMDMASKHDQISSKKSADAIREHVNNGVKLARQYKIPERILEFIPMHHGTTLIKHFYAKALEEATDKSQVEENDYRYPGPKPRNKETAIVMICDTAEALSRVMAQDKEKFKTALAKNVEEKLLDGQFDECNITLKELQLIEETCFKNLTGVGHKRVKYKEIKDKNN